MTTAINTDTESVTASPEVITRTTRKEIVQQIRAEARAAGVACTYGTARALTRIMAHVARVCQEPGSIYFFSPTEMESIHAVLDVVIPDDTQATPGSAHAALNGLLLSGRQVSFTHTMRDRDGEPGFEYCSMHTGVMVV